MSVGFNNLKFWGNFQVQPLVTEVGHQSLRPHLLYFWDYGSADLPFPKSRNKKKNVPTFNSEAVFFRIDHKFPHGSFFPPSGMKSRKQTIVTVVILGMPYNFSIYIILASIIFTMQLVQYSPLCIIQV
jgi:hypothetical protein